MEFLQRIFSPLTIFLIGITVILLKWIVRNNRYFIHRKIPHKSPEFLFGSLRKMALSQSSFNDVIQKLYNEFPDEPISGVFELMNPIMMIRDPEIFKQVAVKDFQYFMNHRSPVDNDADPLFGRNLFSMHGEKWRDMRATLSPAFTGSKMRSMFELVVNCAEDMKAYFVKESERREVVVEMKDTFTRFANDVIATCAFGITINSLKEPKNEFFEMGKEVTDFSVVQSLKFFGYMNTPKLMKLLRIKLFRKECSEFFRKIVMGNISYREENNVHRPDMIQLLMQAKKGKLNHSAKDEEHGVADNFAVVQEAEENKTEPIKSKRVWEDDDLTAQCLIFYFAGFDTASTLLCFIGHELAVNGDVQAKLVEEVDQVRELLDGKPINYDTINKMSYLDMVVTETLRKWPPALILDRVCNTPYKLKAGDKTYNLEAGDVIWFPVLGIHRDPKYYTDPEKFDPERFNEENKTKINPAAYLPFGAGPRNCIGSRFALMETKAILFSLLSEFTFEVSEKTQVPLRLKKGRFTLRGEKGFWVHLKRRTPVVGGQ